MILESKADVIKEHIISFGKEFTLFTEGDDELNERDVMCKDIALQTATGCDSDPASVSILFRFENHIKPPSLRAIRDIMVEKKLSHRRKSTLKNS